MKMEQFHSLLEMGIWVVVAAIGWFMRELWGAVKALQKDIHDVEVMLPTQYVQKNEFNDALKRIEDMLGKIFDKLENKVDRSDVRER
jgi:hypothetical protein